jgi:enoyl-CoA hydratase/carnithine racemase
VATTFESRERDSILTLTLNRPDRLNALTFEVYAELRDTFLALRTREDVRAVIITGAGRGFCSGGDRDDIIRRLFDRDAAGVEQFTRMTCDLVAAMRACPQPIIAAINGACVGAGAMIALASDFRYAVPDAKFGFVFVTVGLSGADMGATFLLPRVVGWTRATELLLTGRMFDAAEAERIGFLTGIMSAEQLLPTAEVLAAELARGPRFGMAITKMLLNSQMSAGLHPALEAETQGQALCMTHPDFKEAYAAFKEKRPPKFK